MLQHSVLAPFSEGELPSSNILNVLRCDTKMALHRKLLPSAQDAQDIVMGAIDGLPSLHRLPLYHPIDGDACYVGDFSIISIGIIPLGIPHQKMLVQ